MGIPEMYFFRSKTARRSRKYPYDSRREARTVKPVSDYLAHFERRRCLYLDSKWCYIIGMNGITMVLVLITLTIAMSLATVPGIHRRIQRAIPS
jgi:hypothetical protein